jgi:hypothetical protein
MNSIESVFSGVGVVAVWLVGAGWGVMLGNFAAVVLRKPTETRSEWIGVGAAAGCVCGFLAMIGAITNVVS